MWILLAVGVLFLLGASSKGVNSQTFASYLKGKSAVHRGTDTNSGAPMYELVPGPVAESQPAVQLVAHAVTLGVPVWIDKSGRVLEFVPLDRKDIMVRQGFVMVIGPGIQLR